jgi:proteic killer suppression protein
VNRTYETPKLRDVCTNDKLMKKAHSAPEVWKPLQRRHGDLVRAPSLADLLAGLGKWHPLVGRGAFVYASNLSANYRLVVQFYLEEQPPRAHVLSIEDYHSK